MRLDIVWASLMLAFLSGCSDGGAPVRLPKINGQGAANVNKCLNLVGNTSWNNGIGQLFMTNCGSCHPGSRPTDYRSYAGVKGNIAGVVLRIDDGSMPPGGMSVADKNSIHAWVAAGLPESDPSSSVSPTNSTTGGAANSATGGATSSPSAGCASTASGGGTTSTSTTAAGGGGATTTTTTTGGGGVTILKPTYDGGVKDILSSYCTSCHSAGKQEPNLEKYEMARSNYRKIIESIQNREKPMPPTGSGPLPPDKSQILRSWGTSPNAPYGQFAN